MSASQPYLMKPAGALLALPPPWPGSTFDPSRGESPMSLSGGGVATAKRLMTKRTYTLTMSMVPTSVVSSYPWFTSLSAADLLMGLYSGVFDDPVARDWAFVDPTVRNMLALDSAATGARSQAPISWASSSGAVAPSTALAPAVLGAGVLSWTASASGTLAPGTAAAMVDPTKGHPFLPPEPATVSVSLASAAATTVTLSLVGYDATGATVSGAVSSVSCAVTSAWQRFTVSIPALTSGSAYGVGVYGSGVYGGSSASAFAGCAFIRPVVTTGTSAPASPILFSAAQLEYATAASGWQPGQNTPRVLITSTIGRAVQMPGVSDHTLTMRER